VSGEAGRASAHAAIDGVAVMIWRTVETDHSKHRWSEALGDQALMRLLTCIVIVIVATAACSSGDPASSAKTGPSGAPSSAPARDSPTGTYEHESGPFGPVILTLSRGRYTEAVPNYQIRVEGTVKEVPDGVSFTELKGGACPGVPGTYTITEKQPV
jgi:hypothetical protein